ncbi:MAG: hypothetical protein JEY96_07665 [Bacteroidales bacterium]|nr:hypothetical protein [Bacteroidales bacterium]
MKTFLFKSALIGIMILSIVTMSCNKPIESKTFTDSRDGKTYKYVKIGDQEWMMENFAFKADTGCWAYNNDEGNVATYGYLYTYETAKNICPDGWHIPSTDECNMLIDYVGGPIKAAYKMMEPSAEYWGNNTSDKVTNSSGFSALPGGCYMNNVSMFMYKGLFAYWWTNTEGAESDDIEIMHTNNQVIQFRDHHKLSGFSIRYIKD